MPRTARLLRIACWGRGMQAQMQVVRIKKVLVGRRHPRRQQHNSRTACRGHPCIHPSIQPIIHPSRWCGGGVSGGMSVWGRPKWMVVALGNEWRDESNRTVFTPFINASTFIISIAMLAQSTPFRPCDLPRKIRAPARTSRADKCGSQNASTNRRPHSRFRYEHGYGCIGRYLTIGRTDEKPGCISFKPDFKAAGVQTITPE